MIRRIVELVLTFVVVAGLVALVTAQRPASLPRSTTVTPTVDVKQVCLPGLTEGTVYIDGAQAVGEVGEALATVGGGHVVEGTDAAHVASGTNAIVGGSHVQGEAVSSWIPCAAAVTQGMLVIHDTTATDLLVVNSDPTDTSVDLTLYGPDGEITAVGSRGIAVAPGTSQVVALSVLAENQGPVGVRMSTSRGRATLAVRASGDTVADATVLSAPAERHFLSGIPQDATTVDLLLSNPTSERVEAAVTAYGATSMYIPEGGQSVSIPAYSTVEVELASSLAGEASGLMVEADGEIAAGIIAGPDGDLSSSGPLYAGTELGAFGPGGGTLLLSNPASEVTTATVDGQVHEIEGGTTVAIDLPGEVTPMMVSADSEIFGAVVHVGEQGVFSVPLQSAGALAADPIDAELDPTLR